MDLPKAGESLTLDKTNLDRGLQENEEEVNFGGSFSSNLSKNNEDFKNPQSKLETDDNHQSKLSESGRSDKASSSQRFYPTGIDINFNQTTSDSVVDQNDPFESENNTEVCARSLEETSGSGLRQRKNLQNYRHVQL